MADSDACVRAEWYRHLAEAAMPPTFALPRDLWRYEVLSLKVADLSNVERLGRVGLPFPHPGRRGWGTFQAIGEQLHAEGWRGLLAPSAARPAGQVLAVFLPGSKTPHELIPSAHTRMGQAPAPPTGMRT